MHGPGPRVRFGQDRWVEEEDKKQGMQTNFAFCSQQAEIAFVRLLWSLWAKTVVQLCCLATSSQAFDAATTVQQSW